MQALYALLFHAVFAAALAAGFFFDVDGARNLVLFYVWAILLPIATLSAMPPAISAAAKKPATPRPLPSWLRRGLLACYVVALVWAGSWPTAFALCLAVVLQKVATECAQDKREKLATQA